MRRSVIAAALAALVMSGVAGASIPTLPSVDIANITGVLNNLIIQINAMFSQNTTSLNLASCGASLDGVHNDTAAWNSCMSQLTAAGGGTLSIPTKKILLDAVLIPANVVVTCGPPAAPDGAASPATTLNAPTFLINSYTANVGFMGLSGRGASIVGNCVFFDPNQVDPTQATPTSEPAVLYVSHADVNNHAGGGNTIEGITIVNGYVGINVASGRVTIRDAKVGGYSTCVNIDAALDTVVEDRVMCQPYWDIYANLAIPQTIDTWVLNNGSCFVNRRIDNVMGVNDFCFYHNTGIFFTDTQLGESPTSGYGTYTNSHMDQVVNCANVKSTQANSGGAQFFGLRCTPVAGAVAALLMPSGGSATPTAWWVGGLMQGAKSGAWSGGAIDVSASGASYNVSKVDGLNPYGPYSTPSFPSSTADSQNTTGIELRVCVAQGAATISSFKINTTQIPGFTTGCVNVEPGETMNFTYTGGTPLWQWYGN